MEKQGSADHNLRTVKTNIQPVNIEVIKDKFKYRSPVFKVITNLKNDLDENLMRFMSDVLSRKINLRVNKELTLERKADQAATESSIFTSCADEITYESLVCLEAVCHYFDQKF